MFDHRTVKALQEHRFNPLTHQADLRRASGGRLPAEGASVIASTPYKASPGSRFGISIRRRLRRAAPKGMLCIAAVALMLGACGDRDRAAEAVTDINFTTDVVVISASHAGSWTPFDDQGEVPPLDSTLRRFRPYPD